MNAYALLWLIVYGLAALLFFGMALVITILGARDLKDLLSTTGRSGKAT